MKNKIRTILPVFMMIIVFIMAGNTTNLPEKEIDNGSKNAQNLPLKQTLNWIHLEKSQRDYNWGASTTDTILSLALSEGLSFQSTDLESKLITTQYELQLVLRLWQSPPLTAKEMALHVLTLMALGKNPKDFHSNNLVAELEKTKERIDIDIATVGLTLCLAGENLSYWRFKSLIEIALGTSLSHHADTFSLTIMALECLRRQGIYQSIKYVTNSAIKNLLKYQEPDGSFMKDLHTTALALQALAVTNAHLIFNLTKTFEYIMSHQLPDGSFGNISNTIAILPFLAGRSLLNIANPTYGEGSYNSINKIDHTDSRNSSLVSDTEESIKDYKINITYIIWSDNHEVNYIMSLSVPENTTFLEIMEIAAEKNQYFEFTLSKWPAGYYIHKLANLKEDLIYCRFWIPYLMNDIPIFGTKPDDKYIAALGENDLMPKTGDHLYFWYHQFKSSISNRCRI